MSSRLSRGLSATVFLVAAAACLSSAGYSLAAVSRPHDLFGLSLLASGLLSALFAAAFVSCLFPTHDLSSLARVRPWLWIFVIALLFVGISVLVITMETPTSFVSWEQWRGAPLPWLESGHFYGPCVDLGRPCRTYWLLSLRPFAILFNLGVISAALHFTRRLASRSSPGNPPPPGTS